LEVLFVVILIGIGVFAASHLINQSRRKDLMQKYGDAEIVDMIMKKMVWQGMSAEQLTDSLGRPVATDRKVYKTKTSETYKYDQAGKNRYRRRVTLENGVVVGWDIK
jgi:outer membrane protein assembly factor BamE (lipoprotein component of BamABCDE complex)